MSSLAPLWLPILASAVAVFIVSSIIHMVIRWHQTDEKQIPNETAVADALRGLPAGEYRLPWAASMKEMHEPAFQEKVKRGPMGRVGIWEGDMQAGFRNSLILWFVYSLVASFISGHVAHSTLGLDTEGHHIFHTVGLTAFGCYGLGVTQQSIWGPKKWGPTFKSVIDGALYALATAGVFVWLWPK
jgi:hypothetical protein